MGECGNEGISPHTGRAPTQESRRPVPGMGRTEISDRRGRTSSSDRPSPRPRARLRRRRPPPSGRSITTTLPPLQSGILGLRRRSASHVSGKSVSQRLLVTLADDTQCRTALTHQEGVLGTRVHRPCLLYTSPSPRD